MTLEALLTLVAVLTPAILSPGPSIIAAIQLALSQGREKALPYGIGLAFGASLWCLFALFGLAVVFKLYPPLFIAAKVLGGTYLLYMAIGLFRGARAPLPAAAERRFGTGFGGGIILSLSNPKPALFYSAVVLSIFPNPQGVANIALIYATALATELFWYSAVTLSMSTNLMRKRYLAAKVWIDTTAALAMMALAVMLIFNL
ncbi:Threonine/homoserine/homoserine lactone efflux protein [Pseudorhodobacter antarcticus]|uniref:Threonine/homoserine/homoserine lactone efflux protein n=1 Tax=Pseudorhodobacter antarcticus TaxID=1077947 RepID=A0A1H8DIT6_9RHOB|nr:LysE family translocator [Pseudorhodobacter antarcticus]SEN07252.1 Threonine/homoserine/homoserine lactone efflux protein [Pseudorhodobacter antarcticus]